MVPATPGTTRVHIGHVAAGIAFAPDLREDAGRATKYSGTSFCAAVHRATLGKGAALRIETDSLEVCRWAPIVLGLREPNPSFNLGVEFRVPSPIASVIVAPLDWFAEDLPPDVVLVRAIPAEIQKIVAALGPERVNTEMAGRMDRSALEVFAADRPRYEKLRVQWVNQTLAFLNASPQWRNLTKQIFRHDWTTYLFNSLLKRFLANMSVCRNAAVIPYLTHKANVSYFCTGGIAWGQNHPKHMACGLPFEYAKLFAWCTEKAERPESAHGQRLIEGALHE